ncbi:MAG: cupin domain-containing protein [Lysobacterales bacterium]
MDHHIMDKYRVSAAEIQAFEGISKTHFLNSGAKRVNKSLGDLTGLTQIGFHVVEVQPGDESTEMHRHYHEEECVYILSGTAQAFIDDEVLEVGPGDFLGYRAGGASHKLRNSGNEVLRCIVVGQRLDHDVADYTLKKKRLFRNQDLPWSLTDLDSLEHPNAGQKR